MLRFVLRRLVQAAVTLLGVTFVLYLVITVLPGDPVRALFGFRPVPPDVYDAVRQDYRLDDPLLVQYAAWIGGWLTGDFGNLYPLFPRTGGTIGAPVRPVLQAAAPATIRLVVGTLAMRATIGVATGLVAVRRGGRVDAATWAVAATAVAVPTMVVAFVVRQVVGLDLRLLPATAASGHWTGYVLPVVAVALATTGTTTLLLRTELFDSLRQPWILAARAKGMTQRRIVNVHALRPAIVPVATFVAASVNLTIQALVVVEGVFNVPGIGGLLFTAIGRHDRHLLVAVVTLLTGVSVAVSTLADLTHAALDPRIRIDR